jgi:hypothetical protein
MELTAELGYTTLRRGVTGPPRQPVTPALRHVPAYRHGGGRLPVARGSRARPHVMLTESGIF